MPKNFNLSFVKIMIVGFVFVILGSCRTASKDPESTLKDTTTLQEYGQPCSNGVLGTPKKMCAEGLSCFFSSGTAPSGPEGSSSARMGECRYVGKQLGESCAVGVYGVPNMPCSKEFKCEYPTSTAPSVPQGSSSGRTGKCVERTTKIFECVDNTDNSPDSLKFYFDSTPGKELFGVRQGLNLDMMMLKKSKVSRMRCPGCFQISFSLDDGDELDISLSTKSKSPVSPFSSLEGTLSTKDVAATVAYTCDYIDVMPKAMN